MLQRIKSKFFDKQVKRNEEISKLKANRYLLEHQKAVFFHKVGGVNSTLWKIKHITVLWQNRIQFSSLKIV
jgi:hypothetical protein